MDIYHISLVEIVISLMSRPDRVYECYYVALCNFDSNDKHLNIKKREHLRASDFGQCCSKISEFYSSLLKLCVCSTEFYHSCNWNILPTAPYNGNLKLDNESICLRLCQFQFVLDCYIAGEMRMKISARSQIYRSVVEGRDGDPGSGRKILWSQTWAAGDVHDRARWHFLIELGASRSATR